MSKFKVLILWGFSYGLISSCTPVDRMERYKYEADFKTYMYQSFQDSSFKDKSYLLVLQSSVCSDCVGNLYQHLEQFKNTKDFMLIYVYNKAKVEQAFVSNFDLVYRDTSFSLLDYPLNIGGPTFFNIKDNHLFNQTSLNVEKWENLEKQFAW